jgi:micrococcal nuclease
MIPTPFVYKCKIVKIYDGDTVTAEIDLGFSIKHTIVIRLAGINAPEIRGKERPEGLRSKTYLQELIKDKQVVVQTLKDKKEKYGRYLGILWLGDLNISEHLVELGYAKKY